MDVAVKKFKIPAHVLVVMKYAAAFEPSKRIANWPFAHTVHPAVTKVFARSR